MSSQTTGFTEAQLAELGKELDPSRAKTDPNGNVQGTYLEGFDVIQRANEIFGYGGWSDSGHVYYEKEINAFCADVTIEAGGVRHEDYAAIPVKGNHGNAIETASKDAYTTAMKRALRKFGDQFGNSLYDKSSDLHSQATPVQKPGQGLTNQNTRSSMSQPSATAHTPQQPPANGVGQPYRFPADVPQDAIPENPVCEFSGEPFTGYTSSTGRVCGPREEAAFAFRDTGGHMVKKKYRDQWNASLGEASTSDFPEL